VCGVRLLMDLQWLGAVRERGSRLDLYDGGVVASCQEQLRVVRYDSTMVRRRIVHSTRMAAVKVS
jgi:hypothetical protein